MVGAPSPALCPSRHGRRLRRTAAPLPPAQSAGLRALAADGAAFRLLSAGLPERFAAKYGFWRPVVERAVAAFLRCGDLAEGFARVRCPTAATSCSSPFPASSVAPARVPPEAGAAHRPARGRGGLFSRRPSASGVHHPQAAAAARPLRPQAAGQAGRLRVAVRAGRSPRSARPRATPCRG